MRISYNPLWKMLIDKGMNKKELREGKERVIKGEKKEKRQGPVKGSAVKPE